MPLHIQYICVGITNCFTLFYRGLKWGTLLSFRPKRSGVEKSLVAILYYWNADDADFTDERRFSNRFVI